MLTMTYAQQKQTILHLSTQPATKGGESAAGPGGDSETHFYAIQDSFTLTSFTTTDQANRILRDEVTAKLDARMAEITGEAPSKRTAPSASSPEGTANFIVSAATSFIGAYAENHPDLDKQALLEHFMGMIRPAIEEGFRLAKAILSSLDVLNGDVKNGVDETYDLVMEKLDLFEQQQLELLGVTDEEEPEETAKAA